MGKVIKREIVIFLFLCLFLSFWMHWRAWLTHPLQLLHALDSAPYGWLHPCLFTFIVYIVIAAVRIMIIFVRRMQRL